GGRREAGDRERDDACVLERPLRAGLVRCVGDEVLREIESRDRQPLRRAGVADGVHALRILDVLHLALGAATCDEKRSREGEDAAAASPDHWHLRLAFEAAIVYWPRCRRQ